MKYRTLGKTGIEVSEVSLGCWTLGGLNWVNGTPNGWANVEEDDIVDAVRCAVDRGVNHFDNADVYGNGRAERMLARAFERLGLRSDEYVIATKVGHFPGTAAHAYEPAHIRHQCEQSLINLRREAIDLYYFHHGDFGQNAEYLEEAAATMDALVLEGKVRAKGQSAYSFDHFARAVPVVRPDVLQSWANMESPEFIVEGGKLSRLMEEEGMSFVAFSPLGQGRLIGKFRGGNVPEFQEGDHRRGKNAFSPEALAKLEPKIAALEQRFGAENLSAVAQRYVLEHPRVACVIPGFRNSRQVLANLSAADFSLTAEDVQFIDSVFTGS
jgi:myo-inositol catabolism protein IolS